MKPEIIESKKLYTALGIFLIVLILAWFLTRTHAHAANAMPAITVKLTTVQQKKAADMFSAVGTVKASEGTDLSTSVPGIIASINVNSGQAVQQGQILFTLKNEDLQATVKEDQSKYAYAKDQYERYKILSKKGVIAHAMEEQVKSAMEQAQAQVDHDQALLNNTIITAPFPGVLGVFQVSVGQYITAGQPIVPLQDRSVLYVDFYIPQRVNDLIQTGRPVTAISEQSTQYQWKGTIQAVGSSMDNETRSLLVRAKMNPPYNNLVPGMYVHISAAISDQKPIVIIPQQAVVYNPYGNAVYIYKNGKVTQRMVELGDRFDDWISIKSGLKPGEQIVMAGQQKLYNGATVQSEKS